MNRKEHLLTCLAEECAEVAQRASKALRFGLHDVEPGQELTNSERIRQELDDLAAVIHMLCKEGMLSPLNAAGAIEAKCAKVERYMLYAASECGTLELRLTP